MAARENLTVRQLAQRLGGYSGLAMVGTPKTIADEMEEWLVTEASDGFTIMFPYLPGGLDDFVELVVPELQRRGMFRREYEGKTLARKSRPAAAGEPLLRNAQGGGVMEMDLPIAGSLSSEKLLHARPGLAPLLVHQRQIFGIEPFGERAPGRACARASDRTTRQRAVAARSFRRGI